MSAGRCLTVLQRRDDRPADRQRVRIVVGEVVGDAGQPRVDVGAAEFLGRDFLAGRRLDERRTGQKDRAGAVDDDRFVRHRRHVRAAGRARSHHDGDLRDALGRHPGLVEEDPPEVLAVREDLGLERQERAARVHQIDARQAVLERDLLRADVLLDGDREVGAALHRRVVGDDRATSRPETRPMPVTRPAAGASLSYMLERGERRQLEERRAGIEQPVDALADGELALLAMALEVFGAAAHPDDLASTRAARRRAAACARGWPQTPRRTDRRVDDIHGRYHPQQSVLKPQAGQRQTACMRYISAPQRSHGILSSLAGGRAGLERGDGFDGRRARGLRHAGIIER